MNDNNKKCCCSKKRNIVGLSVIVLTGLLALDIIFKGQVYKRLPERMQDTLSDLTR